MLRSSVVIFTALLSVIFLKKKLYRHHVTALVAVVLGIFLVGYAGVKNDKHSSTIVGIIVLLVGQMLGATGYIVEEKFLGDFDDYDPQLMAGLEGCWTVVLWLILLPIFNLIPCSDDDLCPHGVIEDTLGAFEEYGKQPLHFLWSSMVIVVVALSYACGLSITKYGSAAQRTITECARNVVIWIFFMFVPVFGEITDKFSWYQLSGFLILLFGIFLYNEIIVIPLLGFDRYTRLALAKQDL